MALAIVYLAVSTAFLAPSDLPSQGSSPGPLPEDYNAWVLAMQSIAEARDEVAVSGALSPSVPRPPVMHDPAPATTTTTPHRGMGDDVERWRSLVADHFDAAQVDTMMCLMRHESGGNPNAKNPRSSARGLFQILASLWAPHFGVSYDDLYDPEINVRLARVIYDQQGYRAWSPYNRGLCRGL